MARRPSIEPPTWDRATLRFAIAALLAVTAAGTAGFMWIEGWDVWRALFFTLITITTVGYGDEGISEPGRRFAILLLIGGIGIASYSFALLVQSAVAGQFNWRQRMTRSIAKLAGHVIVCGFGRMGRTVCEELTRGGMTCVVVESDPEAFAAASEAGYLAVRASGTEDEALVAAGIERAHTLVSAVDSEVENIVVTLTARELQPGIGIIARAERESEVRKLRRAGATRIVSPFHSGGQEVANAILRPKLAEFLARSAEAESDVALAEIEIAAVSPLVGRQLGDYGRSEAKRISFVALERPGEPVRIPPSGGDRLLAGDLLIVAGDPQEILRMRDLACCP